MRIIFAIYFIFSIFIASCGSTLKNPALSQATDIRLDSRELKALQKKNLKLWEERNQKESLIHFIENQTKIIHSSLRSADELVRYARAEFLRAQYFTPLDADRSLYWSAASNWAEAALMFNPDFKRAVKTQKRTTEQALSTLKKKDAEALYWHAASLCNWARIEGIETWIKYQKPVKRMMDRVAALDPDLLHGAVDRFYGSYYAQLPGMDEAELRLSRKYFESAIKLSPDYFENHVLFAELYAKKVDNQDLMRQHLAGVAQGNAHRLKEVLPEQVLEQARARQLLKSISNTESGDSP